jgi:DNA (cytosine-5)-methyltransferase 1
VAHALRGEGFDASEDGTGRGTPIVAETVANSGPVSHSICASAQQSLDAETETIMAVTAFSSKDYGGDAMINVSPTVRAGGHDGSHANAGVPPAIAIQERAVSEKPDAGPDGVGVRDDGAAYTHEARTVSQAVAFDTTQITSPGNYSNPKPGDPCHPLAAQAHVPAVAYGFEDRSRGDDGRGYDRAPHFSEEVAPTAGTVKPPAVAYDLRGRDGGAQFEGPHDTANVRAASGGSSRSYVAHSWAVRRLTPVETSRLQGFSDRYTQIPWRGKPAEDCPDGPQYKAHGNSMAVPVMRWIGRRIEMVEALLDV